MFWSEKQKRRLRLSLASCIRRLWITAAMRQVMGALVEDMNFAFSAGATRSECQGVGSRYSPPGPVRIWPINNAAGQGSKKPQPPPRSYSRAVLDQVFVGRTARRCRCTFVTRSRSSEEWRRRPQPQLATSPKTRATTSSRASPPASDRSLWRRASRTSPDDFAKEFVDDKSTALQRRLSVSVFAPTLWGRRVRLSTTLDEGTDYPAAGSLRKWADAVTEDFGDHYVGETHGSRTLQQGLQGV